MGTPPIRTIAVIQARLGSTRLPRKVLAKVCGKTLIQHLIERVGLARTLDGVVVATCDQEIIDACGTTAFLGDEQNVLGRYLEAARVFAADAVVRLTADNPLVCPTVIDGTVRYFHERSGADHVCADPIVNGSEVEVISSAALVRCGREAKLPRDREHVTSYMREHPDRFRLETWAPPKELQRPDVVVGVDTAQDLARLRWIGDGVASAGTFPSLTEIVRWLDVQSAGADPGGKRASGARFEE